MFKTRELQWVRCLDLTLHGHVFNFKWLQCQKQMVIMYMFKTSVGRRIDWLVYHDNSKYNGFGDKLHLAHNAEVFLGTPRYYNLGLTVNF